jgi:MFS family permease
MSEARCRTSRAERVMATDSFRSAVAIGVSTICALPLFVPAALSQRLRDDLGVTAAELGLMFGLYFFVASLASWPAGRLVERVGASLGMRLGLSVAAISLLGSGLAPSAAWLALSIAGAGTGQAIAQPAANLYLVRSLGAHVLGRAFGLKQAAVPLATLVAGLAVPVAAFVVGWRTLLLLAGGATLTLALMWTHRAGYRVQGLLTGGLLATGRRLSRRALMLIAVTGAFGGAAATSLATFFVDSAVASGISESVGGVSLALASVLGILARVALGILADRRPALNRMRLIAFLLSLGLVGFALLAVGLPLTSFLGLAAGYALGWSWPGLLHLVVATHNDASPARATGGLQVGIALGSGVGPLLFGQLVEVASYRSAWAAAATFAVVAAAAAWLAAKEI